MNKNQENNHQTEYEKIKVKDLTSEQLERYQNLNTKQEKSEQYNSSVSENALDEALEIAKKSEDSLYDRKDHDNSKQNKQIINKKTLDNSYIKTLTETQSELDSSSRVFSKIIHNKIIEKTSNLIGNTIARPNLILFGAIFSFVSTLFVYITAKKIGYVLSGFEPILSFIIGWIIGAIYDYFKLMITGKK